MNIGAIWGGAGRLATRRGLLLEGMGVALLSLLLVALDGWARGRNPDYLSNLGQSAPVGWGGWLLLVLAVTMLGGLVGEERLIGQAGARAATSLPPLPGAAPSTRRAGLSYLPRLLTVAFLVWWPVLAVLALSVYGFAMRGASVFPVLFACGLPALGLVVAIGGPITRLANCAAVLDNLPARQAVRLARTMWLQHRGAVLSLWLGLLGLNLVFVLVGSLAAGLAALIVWVVFTGTAGLSFNASLLLAGLVALGLGGALLVWDGLITTFNTNSWVLAYCSLRQHAPPLLLDDGRGTGGGQALGRVRLPLG